MSTAIPQPPLPDPADPHQRRNPFNRRARDTETSDDQQEKTTNTDSGGSAHRGNSAGTGGRPRSKRMAGSRDVLLSLPAELQQRMESVIAYTYPYTGVKTQQAFIRNAIARACAQEEARFNNGDQWPPVPKPNTG
jgi:hypothetical protein